MELVKLGGNLKSEKQNGTIGQTKPRTSWAETACSASAVSRATPHIRACLHSAGLLQSLTAGKTGPLLWAHSQEKATSASPHSERDIQTFSLPQPQNPAAGWLKKSQRKMTGDKLWGGKGSYFLLTKWKAWECESLSSYFSNKDQDRITTCVQYVENVSSSMIHLIRYMKRTPAGGFADGLKQDKAEEGKLDTKESTEQIQTETKRRKFSSL